MKETKCTSVRYCTHLGRNVIMEGIPSDCGGVNWECLHKGNCGFAEKGCRNTLIRPLPAAEGVKPLSLTATEPVDKVDRLRGEPLEC